MLINLAKSLSILPADEISAGIKLWSVQMYLVEKFRIIEAVDQNFLWIIVLAVIM